jgi:AraC-like DNA-binding protein
MKLNDLEQVKALQTEMISIIDRNTQGVEDCSTLIPNLDFFRREQPTTQPYSCLVEPSVVLVVQGKKQMLLGGEPYNYDTQHFLFTSLDLLADSICIEATPEKPCFGLSLKLDIGAMTELIAQNKLKPPKDNSVNPGIGIGKVELSMLEPFKRLLNLFNEPEAIETLAPLIEREIYYRLLMSNQAQRLWQIVSIGSQSHRIAKAVNWLKSNYSSPLSVDELADHVRMSTSTFHHHFRKLTAMSPLQYQKWLRLSEARRLMLNESLDAATAAFQVGYESPSQFSREYNRLFGSPPKRDIADLRNQVIR